MYTQSIGRRPTRWGAEADTTSRRFRHQIAYLERAGVRHAIKAAMRRRERRAVAARLRGNGDA